MQVHYINHEQFQKGDTRLAANYAKNLIKANPVLNIVTFLVYTQAQYIPFLEEMGFTPRDYKNHGYVRKNGRLQIHTVKTYNPDYLFAGHQASEILIAVGVPPKELIQFEDRGNIAHCIIVPWTLEENREFLSIYEAEDIEVGEKYPKPQATDARIVKAIDWLKQFSYPIAGYHHYNDKMRLHQIANALKKYQVPVDYASVVYCGMHNGLYPSAARKTADAFVRAQIRLFPVAEEMDFAFLGNID